LKSEAEIRKLRDAVKEIRAKTNREDLFAILDIIDDALSWALGENDDWGFAKRLLED